jgi:membrane protease YdiL (CAAX protease family)
VQPYAAVTSVRLVFWIVLVGGFAALGYASYGDTAGHADDIYRVSTFTNGVVLYVVILGIALAIAVERFDLLALRRPTSLALAARIAVLVVAGIFLLEWVVTRLPFEDPGTEQGLAPTHWVGGHDAAFAANLVLFVVIAPFVEEVLFRGLGQSLLRRFGPVAAIVLVGLFFGVWHGLLIALLVLVPFGWALAYLRERTNSVYPGIVVHALFNAVAILAGVLL